MVHTVVGVLCQPEVLARDAIGGFPSLTQRVGIGFPR
jgi:hypothetical protein